MSAQTDQKDPALAAPAEEVPTTETKEAEAEAGQESSASSQHLHLRADGSVLSPQPSTSPDDPLNWSWAKKHAIMLALIPGCMLSDWWVPALSTSRLHLASPPRAFLREVGSNATATANIVSNRTLTWGTTVFELQAPEW